MKLFALVLVPACLANASTTNVTIKRATHQPNANYYAVSEPAYAFNSNRASSVVGVGPIQDQGVYDTLPAAGGRVPEDAMLQLMDANDADLAAGHDDTLNRADMRWFPRSNSSFGAKTFIHKTRCFNGQPGTTVQSSIGKYSYKKCPKTNTALYIGKTFRVAPFLCEESCDKDTTCVGYVVDGAGQNCWTLGATTQAHSSYYRISDDDAMTSSPRHDMTATNSEHEAAASDYYCIPASAYINPDGPTNIPAVNGSAPSPDQPVNDPLLGNIPEDALLQIMDANDADMSHMQPPATITGAGYASLRWLPRSNATFGAKVFVHKSRCNVGKGVAVRASTGTGRLYKRCASNTSLHVHKTFNVAPFLCQQTCDKDSSCTAYMVDGSGENCWIAGSQPPPAGVTEFSYYRISD
jgi:hypothetical protein